jgi:hypothetical protein
VRSVAQSPHTADLVRRGRALLRGVRALRAQLKGLLRVTASFAR